MSVTLTAAQTAGALGITLDWFYRHRGALVAEHGFPPPLPGIRPLRWAAERVQAWINGHPAGGGANDNETAGWAGELDRRAGEVARERGPEIGYRGSVDDGDDGALP